MREDYQPYFQQLCASLTRLGYVSVRERELDAEFTLYSGWKLNFEGERYYGPMFAIFLIPPNPTENRPHGYEIGLLMQTFEELEGKSYGQPTIEGQVEFLVQERDKIFSDSRNYDARYAVIHDAAL